MVEDMLNLGGGAPNLRDIKCDRYEELCFILKLADIFRMAAVYEDDFVCLTDSVLTVKNYYFPNKKTRRFALDGISILWFEEEDLGKCSHKKTWGKSQNGIYWALDVKRCYRFISDTVKCNVVIHYGSKDLVGFTVSNGFEFMECMRGVLDYHVIIVNSINL